MKLTAATMIISRVCVYHFERFERALKNVSDEIRLNEGLNLADQNGLGSQLFVASQQLLLTRSFENIKLKRISRQNWEKLMIHRRNKCLRGMILPVPECRSGPVWKLQMFKELGYVPLYSLAHVYGQSYQNVVVANGFVACHK